MCVNTEEKKKEEEEEKEEEEDEEEEGAGKATNAPVESCMYRTLEHESPFLIVHPFLITSDSSLPAATAGT